MDRCRSMCIFWFMSLVCALATNGNEKKCHNGTGRCFWIANDSQDVWETNRLLCQQEGADLAVMETQELWDFVQSEFSRYEKYS